MNALPTALRRYSPKWARGTLAAVLVTVFTGLGVVTATSASAAGIIQISDALDPNNNHPKQACSIVVEFFGYGAGPHSATIKFSGQGGAGAGTPVASTPASGTLSPFVFAGSAAGGNTYNAHATYALDPIGAGLTKSGNGYLVDVDVTVAPEGDNSQKVIKVTGCDSDMTIQKTDVIGPDPVVAGGNVTYTLTATNSSPINLTSFVITDTVTAPLTFVSASTTSVGLACVSNVCTYNGSLAPAASVTVTVVANVPAATPAGSVTNSASVGPAGGGADYDSDSESTAVTAAPVNTSAVRPSITASSCTGLVASTPSFVIGNEAGVVYSVDGTQKNAGDVITGVSQTKVLTAVAAPGYVLLNAPFSENMVFGALATCTTNTAAVTPTVSSSQCVGTSPSTPSYTVPTTTGVVYKVAGNIVTGLRTGSSSTETLTAEAAPGYVLTNAPFSVVMTFGALATGCNPQPPAPVLKADLGITKVGPTTAVKPGDDVAYRLTVTNGGTGSASGVSITDTLPAALTFVSAGGSGFTCTGTVNITCQLAGSLAPGASAVVDVVAKLASTYAATSVANAAVVLPTDDNPGNNTDAETTAVTLPTPPVDEDLALSKDGLSDTVAPGGILSWTLTVTNVKGTPAAGFTVVDTLPAGLTPITAGGTDWACATAAQVVTCTYTGAPLPVTQSSAFQIDALVDASYEAEQIVNSAVVDPGGVDAGNDTATATTDVVAAPVLPFEGETEEPAQAPTEGGGDPVLPFSGTYTDKALLAGVSFLMLGLLLALAGRRRRTA